MNLPIENYKIMTSMDLDEVEEIFGINSIEDVSWLCCLSESELDFLMSLKVLINQKAKVIGHEGLADKFDLKTLRTLGVVLMGYLKGKLRESCNQPDSTKFAKSLDKSQLLNCNLKDVLSIEEIKPLIVLSRKKKPK